MSNIFLVHNGIEYTYEKLIADVSSIKTKQSVIYVKGNDPYKIFTYIIHSLIYDYVVELVDGDYTLEELSDLDVLIKDECVNVTPQEKISNLDELYNRIKQTQNWGVILQTSGTTGKPKKITHTFSSLTRNIVINSKMSSCLWAYAYNPTHMAGLQVFFQGFLNRNTFVYVFDKSPNEILELFKTYAITNISATPTFYRNFLPAFKEHVFNELKRMTFGGEKYDTSIEKHVHVVFPNAKIRNIYASTEAGSLFIAEGDYFKVPRTIIEYVSFNKENELLLHKDLLGASASYSLEGDWYKTGDLVEVVGENKFKFLSRTTEMINVGGNKVNPHEVEHTLMNVSGVIDIAVKSINNKVTGELIIAEVVKESHIDGMALKKAIKQYGKEHLQQWKIPRMIKFVDHISKSRSGKKER